MQGISEKARSVAELARDRAGDACPPPCAAPRFKIEQPLMEAFLLQSPVPDVTRGEMHADLPRALTQHDRVRVLHLLHLQG